MQILPITIKALQIAQIAMSDTPVPGLGIVLESALSKARKAQEIKDTRDDCRALAERAAGLALAVYQQMKGSSDDAGMKEHVALLLHDLQDVESLMDRRLRAGKRERILFALKHGKIAKEVKDLTTKLEDSFRTFMVQAALDNDQNMNVLTRGNIRIMQHIDDSAHVGDIIRNGLTNLEQRVGHSTTFDGNFRLFAREHLDFLEPIADVVPRQGDGRVLVRSFASQRIGRVFRYRAVVKAAGELFGSQVVVCMYPDRNDLRFVEAVKFAKQACHPYILAVLGYSRPSDPGEACYIVTEDYCPLAEYLNAFRGISKLRILMQMMTEICMAVDHLEQLGTHRLLSPSQYRNSGARYSLGWSELVFDRRHGGRFKWARDPLALGQTDDHDKTTIPVAEKERTRLVEDLRSVARESPEIVARRWFALFSNTAAVGVDIPGRMWWGDWQRVRDDPEYPLGAWLGCNHLSSEWPLYPPPSEHDISYLLSSCISAPAMVRGTPWQGSVYGDRDYFNRWLKMSRWLDVPESDRDEICVHFKFAKPLADRLGANKPGWVRYKFSRVPLDTTLLFLQQVRTADYPNVPLDATHPASSESAQTYDKRGCVKDYVYYTETTVTLAPDAADQIPPPLWFFLPNCDRDDYRYAHPSQPGFWSLQETPVSVPTGDISASSRTLESNSVEGDRRAHPSTWSQVLGDLRIIIQRTMEIRTPELDEDEVLALGELQEARSSSHVSVWDDGYYPSDSESYSNVFVMRGASEDDDMDDESNSRSSDLNDSNEVRLAKYERSDEQDGHEAGSPEYSEDATNSEYHDAEEYCSATEHNEDTQSGEHSP